MAPRVDGWARRGIVLALGMLVLAGCGSVGVTGTPTPNPTDERIRQLVLQMGKFGKVAEGGVLLKLGNLPAPRAAAASSREVTALAGALRSVLGARPGTYVQTNADVLDNETLAKENSNPDYGQLLARWGRQTGYYVAFDLQPAGADASMSLLRASVIISRYTGQAGARDAYAYVLEQQARVAERLELRQQAGARPPWDEAVVFYQQGDVSGRQVGQYTLIFRANTVLGFITNVGLAGAVSTNDTADLTRAVVEQLASLG